MTLFTLLRLSRSPLSSFVINGFLWGCFAAYTPEIKAMIGATDSEYAVALLCGSVGALLAMTVAPKIEAPLAGFAIPATILISGTVFQFPVWTTNILLFAGLMTFVGAATGLLDVIANARLSQIEHESGRPLMSFNHGIYSVAYSISAISAGAAREAGWAPWQAFLGLLLLALLALPLAFQKGYSVEDDDSPEGTNGKSKLPMLVWLGGAITFVAFLGENSVEGWSALHVERTLGGSAAEGALGPAMLGITMAIGRLSGQGFVMRFGERRVLTVSALMAVVGAVIAAGAPVPLVAYAGFALLGFGLAVIVPLSFSLVGAQVPPRQRSRALSRAATVGYFGFFIGPPLMGVVSQLVSLRLSFLLIAGLLGLVPLLLRRMR